MENLYRGCHCPIGNNLNLKIVYHSDSTTSMLQRSINIKPLQSSEEHQQALVEVSCLPKGIVFNTKRTILEDGSIQLDIVDTEMNGSKNSSDSSLKFDITIQLPEGKRLSSLDVNSRHSISLQSQVSGAVAERISLFSGGGSISCAQVGDPQRQLDYPAYGILTAETIEGNIEGEFSFWDSCFLRSKCGNITSTVGNLQHDPLAHGTFTAITIHGAIEGDFLIRKSCFLEANNGSIQAVVKRLRCHRGLPSSLKTMAESASTKVKIQETACPFTEEWILLHHKSVSESIFGCSTKHHICCDEEIPPYQGLETDHYSDRRVEIIFPTTWQDFQNYTIDTAGKPVRVAFSEEMDPKEPNLMDGSNIIVGDDVNHDHPDSDGDWEFCH